MPAHAGFVVQARRAAGRFGCRNFCHRGTISPTKPMADAGPAPPVAFTSKEARMAVSRIISVLAGVAGAGLLLAPAVAAPADYGPAPAAARNLTEEPQQAGAIPLPSLAPLAQRVLPAVVNISVELNQQAALQDPGATIQAAAAVAGVPAFRRHAFDQVLRRFLQNPFPAPSPDRHVLALGSGFIIDPHGDIVTNNHVVDNAEKVTVIFQDQSQHAARSSGATTRPIWRC
jgi:serine protease Do